MFKSLTIKNFRCFNQLNLSQLRRINLIGGVNNAGKTALLEALFLQVSVDVFELPLRLNLIRGVRQETLDVEEICEWLFCEKRTETSVEISAANEENQQNELKLSLVQASKTRLFPINPPISNRKTRILKDLKLEYRDFSGEATVWTVFLTVDSESPDEIKISLNLETGQLQPLPPSTFIGTKGRSYDDVEKFSLLEADKRQEEILEIIQLLEPRLKRLTVLVIGGVAMIYGDIGSSHLIPLPLMGEGLGRLLSIALAIANSRGGTVLIDEIENGLHHSVLEKIWKAIAIAAQQSNTQIFATTHSLECIRAAHQAFSQTQEYDFAYHRLEPVHGEVKSISYDRDNIETSLEMNFEMR